MALTLTIHSTFASSFTPISVDTTKFKMKTSNEFRTQVGANHTACRVLTRFNQELDAIEFRMGILNSNFDYFGWDMNIPMSDFPLTAGYSRELYLGGTPMILSFDGTKLSFEMKKQDALYTRIFPFELIIDGELQTPKSFKGSMAGWEMAFGKPKVHVSQECIF
jgi:hypothetical protein